LTLYVKRGNDKKKDNDLFIKTITTGFNEFPCLDRTLKNKRKNDLNGKIDHPENYKGCDVYGEDPDTSLRIHELNEEDFLSNNLIWTALPTSY